MLSTIKRSILIFFGMALKKLIIGGDVVTAIFLGRSARIKPLDLGLG
jgi:hypothetical protein